MSILKAYFHTIQCMTNIQLYNPNFDYNHFLIDLKIGMSNYKNANQSAEWHSSTKNRKELYKELLKKYPSKSEYKTCIFFNKLFDIPLESKKADFENIIKIAFYIGLFMGINLILKQDNISKKNKEIGQNILDIYQFHTFSNIYQYISDKELEKIETTLPEEYGDKFINTFNKIIKKFR